MLFSGIPFLYYFLPVSVLVYFLLPQRSRNSVLLLFSLIFYAWGEPRYLALMIFSILLAYGGGLLLGRLHGWRRSACLWCLNGVLLALLGWFKYAVFFLDSFHAVTGLPVPALQIALPVGISFYTFQIISYLVDVCRGDVLPQRNLVSLAAYVALFPQLIAGPIVRYADIASELQHRRTCTTDAWYGARRFLIGLGKKVLLANSFGELCSAYQSDGVQASLFAWLAAVAYLLQIYFDFSGYSDMAIGLGRIFGFHFPENFRYPYCSRSITEFWRRWHITLGSWFRDYVYIPLGGNRVSRWKWMRNLLIVWGLTGLWHGAAWNFVLWGLLFALLLMAEKQFLGTWLKLLPRPAAGLYVLFWATVSFVLFQADDLPAAAAHLARMFGAAGAPGWDTVSLYYLRSSLPLLILGAVGATPLPARLANRLRERTAGRCVLAIAEPLLLIALLLICTAYLVDGSYNPFLYFRF